MNQTCLAVACVMLLVAGLAGADSISSSIVCDGAAFVSSSVISQGQTYAANLFTTSLAALMRNLSVGGDGQIKVVTNARSSGPIGIDEYSGQVTNMTGEGKYCVFSASGNGIPNRDTITYRGLLQTGQYVSTRILDSSQTGAVTMVNGSGILLVRASSDDGINETTHTSDVMGEMNMTERIIFGGDE